MLEVAGCNIDRSSLQKIEKGTPPRKISLNELVAFSKVFEAPLSAFLGVDFDAENELTWSSIDHAERLASVMLRAREEYKAVIEPLQTLADNDRAFHDRISERYRENLKEIRDRQSPGEYSNGTKMLLPIETVVASSPLLTTALDIVRGEPMGPEYLQLDFSGDDLNEGDGNNGE
ncbi:hypothetical protein OF385_02635 [Glutamicibacter sp. JL.03c]|uniref:hypothetical protein n=1 Tax=Glutamicibacter sp. JL.03c TaxID=2984842 RepID=UPI0021F6A0F4|nr:hypothetical protein [Glutamicibacter sp. JL.03c]UYQ78086.1 hypothetical protein OF385_02635 [Glutamicibacter sp. JL.03c]